MEHANLRKEKEALKQKEKEEKHQLKLQKLDEEREEKARQQLLFRQSLLGQTQPEVQNDQPEKKQDHPQEKQNRPVDEKETEVSKVEPVRIESKARTETHKTLEDELDELKQNAERMWFNFDSQTPGVIFIKLHEALKDVIDVHAISEHLISNPDMFNARFAYRFLPISVACKASGNMDEFDRQVEPLVIQFVKDRKSEFLERK